VNAPTDAAALVEKARTLGVTLHPESAARLLAYLDAMLALNEQINLTAIRDREQAVVLHALDSLAFGQLRLSPQHVLDVGSGNGFPGLGVAALHPRASVVLMDRTGKKIRAIGTCLLTARWAGIETVQLDAAQAPSLHAHLRAAFDVVLARAVGTAAAMAELADPLCRPGGHLVLWVDAGGLDEAGERLGPFRRTAVVAYDLPEPAARRRLLLHYRRR
jgi:16S rRNA (guanine527-N7)-methyltransferase